MGPEDFLRTAKAEKHGHITHTKSALKKQRERLEVAQQKKRQQQREERARARDVGMSVSQDEWTEHDLRELERREAMPLLILICVRKDLRMSESKICVKAYESVYSSLLRECRRPPKTVTMQRRHVHPMSQKDSLTWEEAGLKKGGIKVTVDVETVKEFFDEIVNGIIALNRHVSSLELRRDVVWNKDHTIRSWKLKIRNKPLRALPEIFSSLICTEDLDLSHNELKSLPSDFASIEVGGRLDLKAILFPSPSNLHPTPASSTLFDHSSPQPIPAHT